MTTPTTFLLEDALRKQVSMSSEFMRYILENKIPGVHYHDVGDDDGDGVGSSKARMMSARPRLVDGAHEDHMVPGYQMSSGEFWGSDHNTYVLKNILKGESGNVVRSEERGSSSSAEIGEFKVMTTGGISHSEALGFLEQLRHGYYSLMRNLKDVEKSCTMLLSIADNLEVLTPTNDPVQLDMLNMANWECTLWELIKEMKTVEEKCSSLITRNVPNPRVYVVTASPYSSFLRALAAEIADRCSSEKRRKK